MPYNPGISGKIVPPNKSNSGTIMYILNVELIVYKIAIRHMSNNQYISDFRFFSLDYRAIYFVHVPHLKETFLIL